MKILIGYDGSACADEALDDLKRAGLPLQAAATVLTAADVFLPPPIKEEVDEVIPSVVTRGIRRAREHAAEALREAHALAGRAAARVRKTFPQWDVTAKACADSPAWALIKKADEWRPDLVVVGSHGHAGLGGRLILGSVSQRVLYEARCSVRVARSSSSSPEKKDASPQRIIIGSDGSTDAEAAIDVVARRSWPRGSEVRLVSVLDTIMSVSCAEGEGSPAVKWVEADDEEDWTWLKAFFETSADKLRRSGLKETVLIKKGNPKHELVWEAEEWKADSIFVGARGTRGVEHFLLGSVSAAVAARAHCSVEVVRPPLKP